MTRTISSQGGGQVLAQEKQRWRERGAEGFCAQGLGGPEAQPYLLQTLGFVTYSTTRKTQVSEDLEQVNQRYEDVFSIGKCGQSGYIPVPTFVQSRKIFFPKMLYVWLLQNCLNRQILSE